MPQTFTVPNDFINELEQKNGNEKPLHISHNELTTYNDAPNCFFCKYINTKSLQENELFYKFMKLYTDNSSSVCKDAIYDLMLKYYKNFIYNHVQMDLSIEQIKNHFTHHSSYATDEILTQIQVTKGIRRHLMNQLAKLDENGNVKINDNNVKLLMSINKELRILHQTKDELPNHIGYDSTLSY